MAVHDTIMSRRSGFASATGRYRPARPGGRRRPLLHIVEDDQSTLALLREVAEDAGWEARGFVRLADFEEATRQRSPDLVILDDDLPDGRGGDRARDLREDPRLGDVPVLVCTAAHPMRQAEIKAWAPVVPKPFDLGQIEALLNAVARRRDEGRGRPAG